MSSFTPKSCRPHPSFQSSLWRLRMTASIAGLEVADVNGDSRPDLIVGARATVGGAAQAGTVTIFGAVPPGAGSYLAAFVLHQDAPTGAAGSPGTADLFGSALATGDFNGDGLVDLATGVPGENAGTTNDTGLVDIFYSPWSNTRSQGLQGIDQALLGDARETDDDFGTALASGDFNGDGFDDLAIGVPGEEVAGGATDQGVVQVIFGGGGHSGPSWLVPPGSSPFVYWPHVRTQRRVDLRGARGSRGRLRRAGPG